MKNRTYLKLVSNLCLATCLWGSFDIIAGEPVPGAEVYIEQEPVEVPVVKEMNIPTLIGFTFINLKKVIRNLEKQCSIDVNDDLATKNCEKLVQSLKVNANSLLRTIQRFKLKPAMSKTVNHYGINQEEIK